MTEKIVLWHGFDEEEDSHITFFTDGTYRCENGHRASWKLTEDGELGVKHGGDREWTILSQSTFDLKLAETLKLAIEERSFYDAVDAKLETESPVNGPEN